MLIFIVMVVIVVLTVLAGIVLAFGAARLDTAVQETQTAIENRDKGYSPAQTLGHRIKLEADEATQLEEAQQLAAKRAAALPRGANMQIGRLGHARLQTAAQGLKDDPISAVKIASFHSWAGAATGYTVSAPATPTPQAVAPTGKIELVPGKDYPVIEITDDMSPDEKRKARIANSKAKSAAMKAAKEARTAAVAEAPAAPAAAAAAPAVMVNMPEPPTLIELTDDMSPDEIRKARIANSKAKSAYNKALKAAGIDPKAAADGQAVPAAEAAPSPEPAAAPAAAASEAAPATALANIPAPDYIEISDEMAPDEVRKARIHNARARSTYNKALKAAGIDPKSVEN
jgi:hypothetical protein